MSNQQRLWGSTLRSPIASPHLSGLTTCLAWEIQLNALMSKFYAEPVLCLKDEHRLRPPCRVAAEASSAALPSCQLLQLLPAAASCLEASWHIRVWQGGASVRSTATVPSPRHHRPQAPSSVGAPLTTQPSASTAFRVRWVQILMVHCIAFHWSM